MDRDQFPNRWNTSEDDLDNTQEDTRTTPISGPFFSKQLRLENLFTPPEFQQPEADDSEEEESSDGRKTKRFRRLFRNLFPKIATKEESSKSSATPSETPKIHLGEAALFGENIPSSTNIERALEHSETAEQPLGSETINAAEPESLSESSEFYETNTTPEESVEIPATEVEAPEIPPAPSRATAPTAAEAALVAAVAAGAARTPERPARGKVHEKPSRGGALIAFLAAEFLSRRRDRKIKRELKKTKEALKKQTEKLESTKQSAQKTNEQLSGYVKKEQLAKSLVEKPQKAEKQELPVYERPKPAPEMKQELPAKEKIDKHIPKTPEKPGKDKAIEKTPEKAQSMAEKQAEIVAWEAEQKQARAERLKEVYTPVVESDKFSEDVPESVFERRHEIKDEPGSKVGHISSYNAQPTSIGSILSERSNKEVSKYESSGTNLSKSIPVSSVHQDSLYKQSIQYGVGTAIAISIFALIAYVVS